MFACFLQSTSNFFRNTSGNIAVTFSLAVVPLLGSLGAAIDYVHANAARTELQAALDSAVLAGAGRYMETNGSSEKALKAANDAFSGAIARRTDLLNKSVSFKVNATKTGIDGTGNADLATTFMKAVGIQTIPVLSNATASAEIAAGGGGSNIEVALMLDVTGSMCANGSGPCTNGTKISGVKTAATSLVDTVIWADQSTYTSKISVVPFSEVVRVGPNGGGGAMMKILTNLDATWTGYYKECTSGYASGGTAEGGQDWTCNAFSTNLMTNWKIIPCATDRYYSASNNFDFTDDTPSSAHWMNGNDGMRGPKWEDSTDMAFTGGQGSTAAGAYTGWNYEANGTCDATSPANEILPLTSNKSTLKSKINGLEGLGGTGGALGTAVSWYTLSPNFSSVWPSGSTPAPYSDLTETNSTGAKKLRKIAVLMSDGGYNSYRGWVDQSHVVQVSSGAKEICAAMKAKGIEIFTVAYDLDNLTSAEASAATSTLQSCGTDVQHFYNSLNATQLQTAFSDIANKIGGGATTIRLVK